MTASAWPTDSCCAWPFLVSALFRRAVDSGVAGPLASLVPGKWLFHLTRPVSVHGA